MKIIRAEISGFGHFRQKTFDFSQGNQLFFGENEAGKSTLYHFIQTMLFGFSTKSKKKRDYTPTDGAAFGGKLWIAIEGYEEIRIERFRSIQRGKATIYVGDQEGDEVWLQKLLAPLTLETFQEVFTFQQEQLTEVDRLQEKELHDALISLGISGSVQVMNQIQYYERKMQELYTPRAQKLPLNKKLNQWQKLKENIQQKEQQEEQVQRGYQQIARYQIQETQNHQQHGVLQKRRQLIEQQQLNWPLYEEWQQLTLVEEPQTSVENKQELQTFYQEYQNVNDAIQKKENELNQLESDQGSDRYFFYLDQEPTVQQILREKITMIRQFDAYQRKVAEFNGHQEAQRRIQQKRGWGTEAPQLSDPKIPLAIETLQAHQEEQANAVLRETWLNEQYEQLLQEINEMEKKQPNLFLNFKKKQQLSYVLFLLSFIAGFVGFLLSGFLQWGLLAIAVVLLVIGGYFQFQQLKNRQNLPLWQEKMLKKEQLRLELEQQQTAIADRNQTISREMQQLQSGFGNETDTSKWLKMVEEYDQEVEDYQYLLETLGALEPKIRQLKEQIRLFEIQFAIFEEWLPLQGKNLNDKLEILETFHLKMQEVKMKRMQQPSTLLAQQLSQLKKQREALFEQYKHLLWEFGLTHPNEIPLWNKQWEEKARAQARKAELAQLLTPLFPEKTTKDALVKQLAEITQAQKDLQQDFQMDLEERKRLEVQIEQLQKDGTLDQLYQEETQLRAEIEELMIEWGKNRLLGQFLTDLATELSEQQLPQLLQQASHYFAILTKQRYEQVVLENGSLFVVSDGQMQSIYQLSTGTKDQLIMGIRFAYLNLQRHHILSPVIIDDGWLHYDTTRKEQLAQLLAEFGKDYQIICLSSDQEMVSYYQDFNQEVKMLT